MCSWRKGFGKYHEAIRDNTGLMAVMSCIISNRVFVSERRADAGERAFWLGERASSKV